jgi:hypothetical protein
MRISSIFWRCAGLSLSMVADDAIRLHLFPFSFLGKVKQWFYVE